MKNGPKSISKPFRVNKPFLSSSKRDLSPIESLATSFSLPKSILAKALILAPFVLALICAKALAVQPLDLAELGRRGLSQKSRDIIVTQALTQRARPPLEIGVVLDLAAYGGDNLARAYLEMDAKTNQSAASPLPPQSVRNLMKAGVAPEEIKSLMESAAEPAGDIAPVEAEAAFASSPTVAETVETLPDKPVEPPAKPEAPSKSAFTVEDIEPEASNEAYEGNSQESASPYAAVRDAISPRVPAAPQAPASPADLRKVPQTLYPGQSADPARPLPEAPGPYWTRLPEPDGSRFMGVADEVKADGHRYEVNTNARGGLMGQEVLSRGSGHKVIRHFNIRPEKIRQGRERAPEVSELPSENDSVVWF